MSRPDISVNNLSSLSTVNLVEKLRSGTGDQLKNEGSIRIGSETYKVTYVPDAKGENQLQMKRNYTGFLIGGFLNWWHRNDLTTQPRAVELTNKVNEMMKSSEYKLVSNTYDKLMEIARANDGDANGVIEVGNYGHSEPRKVIRDLKVVDAVNRTLQAQGALKSIRLNKIDTYNTYLGITTTNMLPEKYGELMWEIANNKLTPKEKVMNHKDNRDLTVETADLQKWRAFISRPEIAAKIDIPKKLYNYLHQSEGQGDDGNLIGWKKDFKLNPDTALRHFVIKNMSAKLMKFQNEEMINAMCSKLKEYVEAYNEPNKAKQIEKMNAFFNPDTWLLSQKEKADIDKMVDDALVESAKQQNKTDIDHVRSKYGEKYRDSWFKKNGANALLNSAAKSYNIFINILTLSTFRQTSKLGLDFFKEQGKPVLFHMSNRDLTNFNNVDQILGENHWKTGEGQLDPTYGGSEITHSEVRHADKLVREFANDANIWQVDGV